MTDQNNEWENYFTMNNFYIYKLSDEAMSHYRDSIVALKQAETIDINMDQITYKKNSNMKFVFTKHTQTNCL